MQRVTSRTAPKRHSVGTDTHTHTLLAQVLGFCSLDHQHSSPKGSSRKERSLPLLFLVLWNIAVTICFRMAKPVAVAMDVVAYQQGLRIINLPGAALAVSMKTRSCCPPRRGLLRTILFLRAAFAQPSSCCDRPPLLGARGARRWVSSIIGSANVETASGDITSAMTFAWKHGCRCQWNPRHPFSWES